MIKHIAHELRMQINAKLKRPLSDKEWQYLQSEKILHKVSIAEITPDGAAAKVQQMREAFAGSSPRDSKPLLLTKDRGGEATPARVRAISELVAAQAAQDESVIQFRDHVLRSHLLKLDHIEAWIRRHAEADGLPTRFLTVALPPGCELTLSDSGIIPKSKLVISEQCPGVKWEARSLEYALPSDKDARSIPVARDGVLNRLRIISERLESRFGWQPAQATLFILTGLTPLVSTFRFECSTKDTPALARITLTIDPALSPREVAQKYREIRKRFVGTRHRSMSDKHSTLVLFMNARPEGETYAQSMAAWNRQYRKWKYAHATNFGRDAQVARQRLLAAGPTKFRTLEMIAEKKEQKK